MRSSRVPRGSAFGAAIAGGLALALGALAALAAPLSPGANPHPVVLVRPPRAPLSAAARLGRALFFDPRLSSSGRLSCASCHSPAHAYGPPGDAPVAFGGPALSRAGVRAVPTLMYLDRQPNFSIGPESGAGDADLAAPPTPAPGATPPPKVAGSAPPAEDVVPQGGLFWDGRADTLQGQALGPMLNPLEMDGGSIAAIAARLRRAGYGSAFGRLFGAAVLREPRLLVSEAAFALGRYEVEEPSFHPYASKFDAWLEGKARFTPAELRGYRAFNDPRGANCAGCHVDTVGADGAPPLFTDHEFEALAVPRNPAIPANRDAAYFDLGLCGPLRTSLRDRRYCGMFLTPTLRNVATRHAFFHNGVYHTLREVVAFYDFRASEPGRVYPRNADGSVRIDDDLPARDRANVDVTDAPFDRARGAPPPLTQRQMDDIVAFLRTLTDRAPDAAVGQPPPPLGASKS